MRNEGLRDTMGFAFRKSRLIKLILLLLVCVFVLNILPLGFDSVNADGGNQIVKVGYYYDSDYYYKDENGSYCGYDAEYFYEMSKYTDWQYQYVDFEGFEDAYVALENGEIDILPSLFYTEERAESLLLSDYDMGSIYVTIVVSPTASDIAYDDYELLEGKNVGILSGSLDGEKYREWADENGLDTNIVEMSSVEELLSALDSGKLDAVAISYLGSRSNYKIIKEFSPMNMYFGMPKDHTEMMEQLNNALERISIETPNFSNELYYKYYTANQQQTPVFTIEEQQYIDDSGAISVGVLQNYAPFSYMDDNGNLTGATIEYFERLSQISGLKFTFRGFEKQDEVISALQTGEIDIIGSVLYDSVYATNEGIILTNSYIDMTLTEITLKGTDQINTIAVPDFCLSMVNDYIVDDKLTIISSGTAVDCMTALRSGEVDAAIINTVSANYYMNNNRVGYYNLTTLNGLSYNLSAGISMSGNRTLLSVLNRCIRYSNSTTMNELIVKYSQVEASSLQATIDRIPTIWLLTIAGIMSLFVIVLILMLMNVSNRHREKEKLLAQEVAVAKRTEELDIAENATNERNQFFANISHDMRTPLNAVIGFAELAINEENEEKKDDYLSKIEASGKLLLDLINDTLTISKSRSEKFELHLEPVRLREVYDSVTTPIRDAASRKNIEFTSDCSNSLDRVIIADRINLEKVFLNLLTNAVKYTPEGGSIHLDMYNEPKDSDNPDSILVVSDSGIGISPEFLPHIYEPFKQEKQHGYETVGTGLGLTIVKQLIEKMGGSIDVKSEIGKGTTFTVRLHFAQAAESELPVKLNTECNNVTISHTRLLLCEDNPLNREIATTLLKNKGAIVDVAENGMIGVEKFSQSNENEYDCILMDVRMPVMDGLKATKTIRSLNRSDAKKVPIIAMTADVYSDDIKKCLEAGMNNHIAKPIDSEELYRKISEVI